MPFLLLKGPLQPVTVEQDIPVSTRKSVVPFPVLTGTKGLARETGDASGPLQCSAISSSSDFSFCPCSAHPVRDPHPDTFGGVLIPTHDLVPEIQLAFCLFAVPENRFGNFFWLFSFSFASSHHYRHRLGNNHPVCSSSFAEFLSYAWHGLPTSILLNSILLPSLAGSRSFGI